MRVLMLGWDFSPRLSGGVGSACRGLAEALTRGADVLATEVLFLLPRRRGDEEPERVRVLGTDEAEELAQTRATATASIAQADPAPTMTVAAPLESLPDESARELLPGPPLPSPAEALRLLAIESPLQPYLSPADYATEVHALMKRLERAANRGTRRAQPARALALSRTAKAEAPLALASPPRPAPRALPPYGRTLSAELERYARAALALAQHERFDVIHAHDWMTFPAAMLLREETKKPLVLHFHSSEPERRSQGGAREARAIEQAALEVAERVVCVSEASAATLRAHYGFELAKLRVVHNAYTPPADFAPRALRARPVVLYLGRLSEQKNPELFLRAAARVLERPSEARFVLAGEGELYPELRALARELGLDKRVRFTGFVGGTELARTYAGADVYVLSSAAEPFGISALEALSLGVPTIVPRGAGVSEVVRSVLLFEPLDAEDLAEKIGALLERPALRAQLSAAGLREVKKLRWDRPARALRGIYQEIASAVP